MGTTTTTERNAGPYQQRRGIMTEADCGEFLAAYRRALAAFHGQPGRDVLARRVLARLEGDESPAARGGRVACLEIPAETAGGRALSTCATGGD